jgi:uncharacterized protein YggE
MSEASFLHVFFAVCFASIAPALADDGGISVSGVGVAKGRPTVVEVNTRIVGEADVAADADAKYNDLKKKAVSALEALKDPNLSLEFGGPSVALAPDPGAQMRLMQGIAADNSKRRVQVSEQLKLVLKGIEKLDRVTLLADVLKVVDTARQTGLQVGDTPANYIQAQLQAQTGTSPEAIAVFKVPDRSELEAQAYEKAVADARVKAERIAKLSGVKLGRVSLVQDQATSQEGNQLLLAAIYSSAASVTPESKEVESAAMAEIPVTVRITVKFEIEKQ